MTFTETIIISSIPAILSTTLAYMKLKQDLNAHKTNIMAEKAAKRLLKHKGYIDRSFEAIKKTLGGWDDEENELRKILVRAGAVRTYKDDEEWWYLLSRTDERIAKFKGKKK